MATLYIPKGNKGYNLKFNVVDSNGAPFSLSGYTVTLKVWTEGTPGTLTVDTACTVTTAASGTLTYLLEAALTASVADYKAELELTATDIIIGTKSFDISITESG